MLQLGLGLKVTLEVTSVSQDSQAFFLQQHASVQRFCCCFRIYPEMPSPWQSQDGLACTLRPKGLTGSGVVPEIHERPWHQSTMFSGWHSILLTVWQAPASHEESAPHWGWRPGSRLGPGSSIYFPGVTQEPTHMGKQPVSTPPTTWRQGCKSKVLFNAKKVRI